MGWKLLDAVSTPNLESFARCLTSRTEQVEDFQGVSVTEHRTKSETDRTAASRPTEVGVPVKFCRTEKLKFWEKGGWQLPANSRRF